MYHQIGKYISEKAKNSSNGDSYVQGHVDFFEKEYPELKGFTRLGLYRMKQFYELYNNDEKVSTLLTQ